MLVVTTMKEVVMVIGFHGMVNGIIRLLAVAITVKLKLLAVLIVFKKSIQDKKYILYVKKCFIQKNNAIISHGIIK